MIKIGRNINFLLLMLLFTSLLVVSCDNEEEKPIEDPDEEIPEEQDPCASGPKLSIEDFMHSYEGKNSGFIKLSTSGGSGTILYSIDGKNFSENDEFEDLAKGNYTITVKDENECVNTINFEILEFPEVSFDKEVYPIIETNCLVSGCHLDSPGLPKWDNYDIIAANAGRIRMRVSNKTMPPPASGGSLTEEEILTIQNWVDVGAPDN